MVDFWKGIFSRQIAMFVLILLSNRWIFTEKVVNIWKGIFSRQIAMFVLISLNNR